MFRVELVHSNHEEYVRRLDHIRSLSVTKQFGCKRQNVLWYEMNYLHRLLHVPLENHTSNVLEVSQCSVHKINMVLHGMSDKRCQQQSVLRYIVPHNHIL